MGVDLSNQVVGQLQVGQGILVHVVSKIPLISVEGGAQTMVTIEHGGHAIEAEAVKMELREPILHVGEQKVEDAVFAVVKEFGAPSRMIPSAAAVEKLPHGAVKFMDALRLVAHGVGVYQIQQHPQAQLVGTVDEVLQLLRRAEPAGRGEKVGNLIAEAGVIGMLHNGHQLHCVVSPLGNPGQRIVRKRPIAADARLLLSHAHMGFIDEQRLLLGHKGMPGKWLLRLPHPSTPQVVLRILGHIAGIEWDVLGDCPLILH